MPRPSTELARRLVAFTRLLRQAGIASGVASAAELARAISSVELGDREQVRSAARALLVHRQSQIEIFDRLFDAFFAPTSERSIELGRSVRRVALERSRTLLAAEGDPSQLQAELDADILESRARHSEVERLRHKDFARLCDDERRQVLRILLDQPLRLRPRRSRRRRADRRGARVDLRRTLRHSLRRGGEPIRLERSQHLEKARPVVVLCDLSGSMEAYGRILLPFVYTLRHATRKLEAFVFATRLTRVTRHLDHRRIDRALSETAAAIVDWGGGTRIGESFHTFNQRWNRRVLGGGSVVLVISDAWDRGDPELLGHETERLARSCHRLIWLNPLVGSAGYEPIASGARAILPHVDDFLPCHNITSLDQLREILRALL